MDWFRVEVRTVNCVDGVRRVGVFTENGKMLFAVENLETLAFIGREFTRIAEENLAIARD